MADDVVINDGTGTQQTIATDQLTDVTLGTVHVQYTKQMDGTLGSTAKTRVGDDGAASSALEENRADREWQAAVLFELQQIRKFMGILANQPTFLT